MQLFVTFERVPIGPPSVSPGWNRRLLRSLSEDYRQNRMNERLCWSGTLRLGYCKLSLGRWDCRSCSWSRILICRRSLLRKLVLETDLDPIIKILG